jgi:protein gp37
MSFRFSPRKNIYEQAGPSQDEALDRMLSNLQGRTQEEALAQAMAQPLPRPFRARWHPLMGCGGVANDPGCVRCPTRTEAWGDMRRRYPTWTLTDRFSAPQWIEPQLNMPAKLSEALDIEVAPFADLFDAGVDDSQRLKIFDVIRKTIRHRYFLATRHPARVAAFVKRTGIAWPLPNLWLGTSVSDQASYARRVPELLLTPAAHHYVMFQPLVGAIRSPGVIESETRDRLHPFRGHLQAYEGMDASGERRWARLDTPSLLPVGRIEWCIIGGAENALDAGIMPPHPQWVQALVDEARVNRVPVWFQGFGEYAQVASSGGRESDPTLLLMQSDGMVRGRGAGSATNVLSTNIEGEAAAVFTRRVHAHRRLTLNGQTLLQRPRRRLAVPSGNEQDSVATLAEYLAAQSQQVKLPPKA